MSKIVITDDMTPEEIEAAIAAAFAPIKRIVQAANAQLTVGDVKLETDEQGDQATVKLTISDLTIQSKQE